MASDATNGLSRLPFSLKGICSYIVPPAPVGLGKARDSGPGAVG